LPILTIDAPNGIDIYLLNNPHNGEEGPFIIPNIQTWQQLVPRLGEPIGLTPIVKALRHANNQYQRMFDEQGLLTILITDGAPTDNSNNTEVAIQNFYDFVKNRNKPEKNIINILTCLDEELQYLEKMDTKAKNVDVSDDYETEKAQVKKVIHNFFLEKSKQTKPLFQMSAQWLGQ
jgi:hypothetical protein